MLTRRRFLSVGAAGLAAAAGGGCRPLNWDWQDQLSLADDANLSLEGRRRLANAKDKLLGYPINMNTPPEDYFAWRQTLFEAGLGRFAYNNVGNPFKPSPIPFNSHDFEREIIRTFAGVYAFPGEDVWGFLSHSGTDSNMHGMYMGRTILNGRTGRLPKAYFTKEAHYSVQILRDLLGMEGVEVQTTADGAMDVGDLARKLEQHRDAPALVVATIGTTFKGAIDPIDGIREALQGRESFLHLDAALFGGYLPHTEHAEQVACRSPARPDALRYDAIAVSCHKFFGFPSPAGLFITTAGHFEEFNRYFSKIHNPEYIHHVPGTITCSRDAVKPAEFYYFSRPAALQRMQADAEMMLQNSDYFQAQMLNRLPKFQVKRANALSNTLYFRKPSERIIQKYSLATMQVIVNGEAQDHAHVVVMPHVSRAVLDEFVADLVASA